jgi:hypothetical protein
MEITDRSDLGADLHAPQRDDGGNEYWSYALVTAVRPGDVIFHWHKRLLGSPGIVGHSIAAAGPEQDQIIWTAHGSYGRIRPGTTAEPSWRYALTDYSRLPEPIGQDRFRTLEPRLRKIRETLEARYAGPLYFPFAFSDKRPVRAAQGYLVKFPADIVSLVRELRALPRPEPDVSAARRPSSSNTATTARRRTGSGLLADKVLQMAIERHAVDWTLDHYDNLGYEVLDVGATHSYDVHATRDGEELHIEVKGSSGTADAIELTAKEVVHGRTAITDLVVVDQIGWERQPDGSVATYGGRARRWSRWSPADLLLKPTRYRYQLPDDNEEHEVA